MSGPTNPTKAPERGDRSDRDLIGALAADLRPVRRAPPLVLAAGAVLAVASAGVVVVLSAVPALDAIGLRLVARPEFTGVLLGLVVAGVAGTLSALSGAAPDREPGALRAGALAAGAVALAAALCLVVWSLAQPGPAVPLSGHLACLRRSAAFAMAPAAALLFFCLRGWVARPSLSAAAGLIGAFSLGALAVHLECEALEPQHLLIGHLGAPVLATALGIPPLGWLLRRFAR